MTDLASSLPPRLTRLAAGLAHELRNPLNAARLQLGALVRPPMGTGLTNEARSRIQAANTELQRISDLIDDYMSLTEPRTINPTPIVLAPVATRSIECVAATMPQLVDRIKTRIPKNLPTVLADAHRLTQVFVHLLKNALEATNGRGESEIEIAAAARKRESVVDVTVRDNGPGISEDIRDLVFHPFMTTKKAGTGLGLTLVQQLVNAHGGQLALDSRVGNTVVHFTLPIVD